MLGFHISPCIFLITYLCSPIIDKSKYYGNTDIIHFEHLEVFSKIPLLDIILISIFRRCSWWFLVKMESIDTHLCLWNREKNFRQDPFGSKKSFWYFFDHQWSERSCFKKIIQNFFSSRKVTFGHFFEKNFCPRWQVENSTMTLKFWALRSKGVKTSLGARITLIMIAGAVFAGNYFGGELSTLADSIKNTPDWNGSVDSGFFLNAVFWLWSI